MANIEYLPDEMLVHIFNFLKLKDRKNTRLVSKRWRSVSYELALVKSDVTVIRDYEKLDTTFNKETKHRNVIVNLKFKRFFNMSHPNVKFWTVHGPEVQSLELYSFSKLNRESDTWLRELTHILNNCPNLKDFTFEDRDSGHACSKMVCDLKYMSMFAELKELQKLQLSAPSKMAQFFLNGCINNSPLLQNISVSFTCFENCLMDCREMQALLCIAVNNLADKLKVLDVICDTLQFSHVHAMIEPMGPQLTRLRIDECDLESGNLQFLGHRVPYLKQLLLTNCLLPIVDSVEPFEAFKQLTAISFEGSSVVDDTLGALAGLTNLSHLNLSYCELISDDGIRQIVGQRVRPQMSELRLAGLFQISDVLIAHVLQYLPNLQTLSLQGCDSLTDLSLQSIFKHNLRLNCLSIEGWDHKIDIHAGPSVNVLVDLRHLDVRGTCVSLADLEGLMLPRLEVIDFSGYILAENHGQPHVPVPEFLGCPSLYATNLNVRCNVFPVVINAKTVKSILQCHNSPFGSCYRY